MEDPLARALAVAGLVVGLVSLFWQVVAQVISWRRSGEFAKVIFVPNGETQTLRVTVRNMSTTAISVEEIGVLVPRRPNSERVALEQRQSRGPVFERLLPRTRVPTYTSVSAVVDEPLPQTILGLHSTTWTLTEEDVGTAAAAENDTRGLSEAWPYVGFGTGRRRYFRGRWKQSRMAWLLRRPEEVGFFGRVL